MYKAKCMQEESIKKLHNATSLVAFSIITSFTFIFYYLLTRLTDDKASTEANEQKALEDLILRFQRNERKARNLIKLISDCEVVAPKCEIQTEGSINHGVIPNGTFTIQQQESSRSKLLNCRMSTKKNRRENVQLQVASELKLFCAIEGDFFCVVQLNIASRASKCFQQQHTKKRGNGWIE